MTIIVLSILITVSLLLNFIQYFLLKRVQRLRIIEVLTIRQACKEVLGHESSRRQMTRLLKNIIASIQVKGVTSDKK